MRIARLSLLLVLLCGGCEGFRYGYNHADHACRMLSTQATDGKRWLALEKDYDAVIRGYVAGHGEPDYLYTPNSSEVYLIYLQPEKCVRCKRPFLDTRSRLEETDTIPSDLRSKIPELNPSLASGASTPGDRGGDATLRLAPRADAQVQQGLVHNDGTDAPQDHKEALKWYGKAAEQGDAVAQSQLGAAYFIGEGAPQDYKAAVKWFRKAAEQGQADAQCCLGHAYSYGRGVPQDYREAVKWYGKAAEQGDAVAQSQLGFAYFIGEGAPQDYKAAVKWFRKAAEQGYVDAQWGLGWAYYMGRGVLEDYAEAYKWVVLAQMNGANVQSFKDRLRAELTPAQIAEGQRRAKEFLDPQERGSEESDGRIAAMATGFLISSDGYLLTACHAVEESVRVEVVYQSKTYPATVIAKDPAGDAAVLKIQETALPCLPVAASTTVKMGDTVFTLGFPQVGVQGGQAKFTEGSISSLSGYADSPRFFQISVPIQPGNSGGPLVNEQGEVIGLIVSRLDDIAALLSTGAVPQMVNYGVKSSFILPLLESVPGLKPKLAKPSPLKDRSGAIERTRTAVVQVITHKNQSPTQSRPSPPQ